MSRVTLHVARLSQAVVFIASFTVLIWNGISSEPILSTTSTLQILVLLGVSALLACFCSIALYDRRPHVRYFAIKLNDGINPRNPSTEYSNVTPDKVLGFSTARSREEALGKLFAEGSEKPENWLLAEGTKLRYTQTPSPDTTAEPSCRFSISAW